MAYLPNLLYNDHVLNLSFGIHSSLAAGIPSFRIVNFNSEAATVNESSTDQTSVGFAATANASAQIAGVVIDGCTPQAAPFYPSFNRDQNVTVTLLGVAPVEVVPGQVLVAGAPVFADAVGRAATSGTATSFVALQGTAGTGTATNPEYVLVLVR